MLFLKVENVKSGHTQYDAECNCSCFIAAPHCKSYKTPTTFLLHSCVQEGYRGRNKCHSVRHLVVICPIVPSCGVGVFHFCTVSLLACNSVIFSMLNRSVSSIIERSANLSKHIQQCDDII